MMKNDPISETDLVLALKDSNLRAFCELFDRYRKRLFHFFIGDLKSVEDAEESTAHDVLKADFYGVPFPGAKNMRKNGGVADLNSRWFVIERNFRNPDDYRWPIPQSEQDTNPNLRN